MLSVLFSLLRFKSTYVYKVRVAPVMDGARHAQAAHVTAAAMVTIRQRKIVSSVCKLHAILVPTAVVVKRAEMATS